MSGISNYAENLLLTWLFTTDPATRPTGWHVSLHTADPGETGSSAEVTVGTDASYARKSITFDTAASGAIPSDAAVTWTVNAGSAGYTVSHIAIWDAATSGNCLMKGPLPVARALSASQVLTFSAGDIVATLD